MSTDSISLPANWTQHKAPTGHTYYYNSSTKESTYKRPENVQSQLSPPPPPPPPIQPAQQQAPQQWSRPQPSLDLSDPKVANAYMAQFNPHHRSHYEQAFRGGHGQGRGRGRGGAQHGDRPKPQPMDKPVRKEVIPGCEPWVLVYTKYSRRFVYNPIKNNSYWRIPEKLMTGILELDKRRIQERAGKQSANEDKADRADDGERDAGSDSSEYEEVEVTDDEGEEDAEDESQRPTKRQRTLPNEENDDAEPAGPVEFTEADIAAQLQAMGDDYGLEPGDYDDGNMEEWPEGAEGIEFSEDDAKLLFKDLLDDFGINPYSPWETILEQGRIVDDPRYTALTTTKARRECWDEWSRERIARQKAARAKSEKKDPRIQYLAFLQEKATPKLYWPEFKRKYKKEEAMKSTALHDKDREKLYREHINRLKMTQPQLKSDLKTLLRSLPLHVLHNKSWSAGELPTELLTDVRYVSLPTSVRDPIIEAYVQTLPPPPEDMATAKEEEEERRKEKELREKRERALAERNKQVEEDKRKREREVRMGKERIRETERETEEAMRVGKRGLLGQLESESAR